ncbi:DDB1- and CUL4-associated factor 4 [Bombina bombina]|uniref:DDB1- and CUL4-associated factor 4 n=1 Tax=Bombina bombina TaxID=8345 RepID=UPI00235A8211|nr:DDB1- and CUL4-associated factor 4 [Bombina bombina]
MGPKRDNGRHWNRRYRQRQFNERFHYREHLHTSSAARNGEEISSSSNSSQSSSVPELPGFYYDPEKNRYFRLLPGHNNCNPLTKEIIQQRKMESERQKLIEEEKHGRKSTRKGLSTSSLLLKRQLGLVPFTTYCRRIHEIKACNMQRRNVVTEFQDEVSTETHRFELILADSTCKRLFAVNNMDNGYYKNGILNLNGLWKSRPTVERYDIPYFTNQKVNAACWASLTAPDSHLLVCHMRKTEPQSSISLIPACLFRNEANDDERPEMLYTFRISNAWSCAWCSNPQLDKTYSAGLRQQILVMNAITDVRRTFKTDSDILAQRFGTQSLLLYSGSRAGEVFAIDLRVPAGSSCNWKKAVGFHHNSAITSMHLLQDENYLMVTDMSGEIKLWDLRVVKCVKRYLGNINQYAILPLHINEEEGLLLTVGQDCHTRIWDLQNTKLLRTIPSPHPASKDAIPSIVFSSHLGGKGHNVPGLLMAVKKDLYHFTY